MMSNVLLVSNMVGEPQSLIQGFFRPGTGPMLLRPSISIVSPQSFRMDVAVMSDSSSPLFNVSVKHSGLRILGAVVVFGLLLRLYVVLSKQIRRRRLLPPGPQGLPLLGNLLQLYVASPLDQMIKWKKEYGVSTATCETTIRF